jgi:hypothetical protein
MLGPLLLMTMLAPATEARDYDGPTAVDATTPPPPEQVSIDKVDEPLPKVDDIDEAAPRTEPDPTWRVGGAIDIGYAFSSNLPQNHVYRGMVPTPRLGEFALNVVNAFVDHEPTDAEPWRFELLLHAGAGIDALAEPEPVAGGSTGRYAGAEAFKHIGLANVGFRAPTRTTIVGGLQPAPLGTEWFWPHRNWLHTVSWTANGTPFYLMGVRVDQELPRNVHIFGWVVNGWQTIADLNEVPSYLGGLNWHPREDTTVAAMVYFGPDDRDPAPEAWRVHGDAFVVWDGPRGGVGAVWDAGRERLTLLPGQPVALWTGGALFGRVRPYDGKRVDVDLAARPEAWWDRDGRIFGVPGWLVSGTANASLHFWEIASLRFEYRYDHSTAANGFFYRRGATADDEPLASEQHLLMLFLTATFDHHFAARRRP